MRMGILVLFQISARRLSQLFIGEYYIGCGMFVINGFYYVEKCFLRPRVFFNWDTRKAWNDLKGRTYKGQKTVVLVLKTWSWFYENTKNKNKQTESKGTGEGQWHGFGLNLVLKVQVRPHEELGVGVEAKRLAAGLLRLPGCSASAPARLPCQGRGLTLTAHRQQPHRPQRARTFQGNGNSVFCSYTARRTRGWKKGTKTLVFLNFSGFCQYVSS